MYVVFIVLTVFVSILLIGILSVCSAYTLPKVSDGTAIRTEAAAPAPSMPAGGEFGTPAPAAAPAAASAETPAPAQAPAEAPGN